VSTKLEKMARELNDRFRGELDFAFLSRFGVVLVTEWNFISFNLVSGREDGEDMTTEQRSFVTGYSEGYSKAMGMVRSRDMERHFAKEQGNGV
jgi:hypothetical protein